MAFGISAQGTTAALPLEQVNVQKMVTRRLFILGVATRIVVLAIGILAPQKWKAGPFADPQVSAQIESAHDRWIEPWYRWDACQYMHIALFGYQYNGDPTHYSNVAFMPLLPVLVAGGSRLGLDPFLLGLAIPNVAFVIGLVLFGRIVLHLTRDAGCAWRAGVLLTSFPTAFFFSAPYQESLGFLYTALSLMAWIQGRDSVSAMSIGIAATARQASIATALALPADWVVRFIKGQPRRHSAWLVAAAGFAGSAAVSFYMYLKFGDALVSSKAQAAWGRSSPSPLNVFRALWPSSFSGSYLTDYVCMVGVLALSVRVFYRRGALWGCACMFPILLAMSTGTALSMKRYVLSSFVVFIEMAELLNVSILFWAVVSVGAAFQVALLYSYVNWGFARG